MARRRGGVGRLAGRHPHSPDAAARRAECLRGFRPLQEEEERREAAQGASGGSSAPPSAFAAQYADYQAACGAGYGPPAGP